MNTGNSDLVQVDIDDRIAKVQLNNPPLNTFDTATQVVLLAAIRRLAADEAIRVLVLTGSDRAFAAGADINELASLEYEAAVDWNHAIQQTFSAIAELPIPVIAAVNGFALGGGMELALAADYRIASRGAKMGQPEVLLGIIPGSGGTQRLRHLVGPSRAKELLMTGRQLSGEEAQQLGIVDELAEDNALPAALTLARRLARGPRRAIQAIKQAIDHGWDVPISNGLAFEQNLIAHLFATADCQTGMQSFLREGAGKAEFS